MTERPGIPLPGGNTDAPVRIGDRVHRAAGPWTPTVHAYLRHVRAHGAPFVPEPFGVDDAGREVLAFLPGDVPAYPLPAVVRTDAFLVDAARVLRRLHDASLGFAPEGAVWRQPARDPQQVIAVNDFAPYNLVLDDAGRITGVIDLDQASSGPRARDLAHVAYRLVPLTADANPDGWQAALEERARRLKLLTDAYGGVGVAEILEQVEPVLAALAEHAGTATALRPALTAHVAQYRGDAAWFRESRRALQEH